ncbi:MAG: ABC transporter ATP-binding protein [Treponema sp.]|nr:ABC transporter ATP-binding protein [Treponema sp.]
METKLHLGRYVRPYAVLYTIAVISMGIGTWLDMIAPVIVQHIVDDVLIARKMDLLKWLLLGILGIGVGRCIFQYAKEFICDWCGSKIASEVRINLFQKIQSLSATFFDGINSGELMSRVKDDVDRIWDIAAFMGILIAEVVLRVIITTFYMMRMNWKLSLFPLALMIAAGVIAILMEKKLDDVFGDIAQENSELNNTAAENLAGIRTVKAFSREDFEKKKFHRHNQKYYELNITQSKIFVHFNPMVQLITRLLPAAMLFFGGLAVIAGNVQNEQSVQNGITGAAYAVGRFFNVEKPMTIGELLAFLQYVGNIVWPMEMLGWLTNGFSSAKASVKRLNKIYEQTPRIVDNSVLSEMEDETKEALFNSGDISGHIQFENVTYMAGDRKILDNVSFDLKAGQTLGIMGATGSGKTTIINLLKRMYDVSEGRILLDGLDIREIPLAALRRSIACVMQDIFLFSDTIDGNIRLGEKETMSHPAVRQSLEKAQAWSFVSQMKDAEQTVIGERGIGLSGGQKQRITIARALARKTPVLVLDDSTSALDSETEQEIQQVLNELSGMTKIIIGHRISSVRRADKIIVLENGRIAESGTHEELLEANGLYKETYDSQH